MATWVMRQLSPSQVGWPYCSSWRARYGEDDDNVSQIKTLDALNFLYGEGWHDEIKLNRKGNPVRMVVHDSLLQFIEVKWAPPQVRCSDATSVGHICLNFQVVDVEL